MKGVCQTAMKMKEWILDDFMVCENYIDVKSCEGSRSRVLCKGLVLENIRRQVLMTRTEE